MSRTLIEAKIAGRAERKRLASGIHWRGVDPDIHLGYRKGKRGGAWLVRWYVDGAYRQRTLGTADDELSEGTLDYGQAVKEARLAVAAERRKAKASAAGPLLTVQGAIEAYTLMRDAREARQKGRETRSDATSRLTRHVTGYVSRAGREAVAGTPLSGKPLHELNEKDLMDWRRGLPSSLKSATKQRLINDLKAALNGAYRENRSRLPETLPITIKYGLSLTSDAQVVDPTEPYARENQILSDGEVTRLIRAAKDIDDEQGWEGDLFRLVVLLAATGARFSQVARLRVVDVQAESLRIVMPMSRKGKPNGGGEIPVPIGLDVLSTLQSCLLGRKPGEPLLERWWKKQVAGEIRWERNGRGPWKSASELLRPWAIIRGRANLPRVIPYALRHSSIVRGIRANLPVRLVAALHDTSVAMIERHYGRHIADGLDELAARSVVPLL